MPALRNSPRPTAEVFLAVWALTVVTCAVPSVLPEIQSTGVACEATVIRPMPGTPSVTGLKCQEISDEVPQLVGLKHQVRHGLVRRLKRHLQRHRGHARHVGDLCSVAQGRHSLTIRVTTSRYDEIKPIEVADVTARSSSS